MSNLNPRQFSADEEVPKRRSTSADVEGISAPPKRPADKVLLNQQALPGMEEHAHAGARLLAKGWHFEGQTTRTGDVHQHTLMAFSPENRPEDQHTTPSHAGRKYEADSFINWAGSLDEHADYPGEIEFVSGGSRSVQRQRAKGQGVPTALFRMAHDPRIHTGDDTVPFHSPVRTNAGYAWSQRVGGFDPELHEYEDHMDKHPFMQRQAKPKRPAPAIPGQEMLSDHYD